MSEIRQFLVYRDDRNRRVSVYDYGDKLEAAVTAYNAAENAIGLDPHAHLRGLEVCLFGTDSVETLKRTHGSWFPAGYPVETNGAAA